jgi:hypothetical protein
LQGVGKHHVPEIGEERVARLVAVMTRLAAGAGISALLGLAQSMR